MAICQGCRPSGSSKQRIALDERAKRANQALTTITIMVLELRPPASPTWAGLLQLWPTVVSYIVSHVFVAIIWMNHHYLMTYVTTPSLKLIWPNFGHLFCVSFLPFATAWLPRPGSPRYR